MKRLAQFTAASLAVWCAAPTALPESSGGDRHLWQAATSWPWAIGQDQGPPPPVSPQLSRKFAWLVVTYDQIGSDIPVSFLQWIRMNGVTDPTEQWVLLSLWWNLTNQGAAD